MIRCGGRQAGSLAWLTPAERDPAASGLGVGADRGGWGGPRRRRTAVSSGSGAAPRDDPAPDPNPQNPRTHDALRTDGTARYVTRLGPTHTEETPDAR